MSKPAARNLWGLLLLCAIFAISGLGIYQGVENIRQAEGQLGMVLQTNHALDKENRVLYRSIQNLKQDRQALERLCRNELNLVRADEVIYQLP